MYALVVASMAFYMPVDQMFSKMSTRVHQCLSSPIGDACRVC